MAQNLTRQEASDAVGDQGWRLVLGVLRTSIPVEPMARAAEAAARVVAACGDDADGHLHLDIRPDRVVVSLQSLDHAALTARDVDLAHRITAAMADLGLRTEADVGSGASRSVQVLEIAIDALDIAAIRPFWKAVLGYADEPGSDGLEDPIVDPVGQGPAIWFQQMDLPRPQRNRLHVDVSVPHDEAPRRLESALSAGGHLVSATDAPAYWVLSDPEGNEACITTWQGRDT